MSKKKKCPMLRGACIEEGCMFWVHMVGKKPDTGVEVDLFDCSFRWIPSLMMKLSGQESHTASAVEDMRNLLHRGLTRQLTDEDFSVHYDGISDQNGVPIDGMRLDQKR
jgi:hypothetical protein